MIAEQDGYIESVNCFIRTVGEPKHTLSVTISRANGREEIMPIQETDPSGNTVTLCRPVKVKEGDRILLGISALPKRGVELS